MIGTLVEEGAPAFSVGLEISLKHWHKNWMELDKLRPAELQKFCHEIRHIQRQGIRQGIKPVSGPTGLKLVDYRLSGHLYEIKLGGERSRGRIFIGMKTEEPSRGYLMYVDPLHEICKK